MKRLVSFLKATLIGGLVFVVPLVVTVLIVRESVRFAAGVVRPVSEWIPAEHVAGVVVADLIAGAAIVALCFAAGLFIGTRFGKSISDRLEEMTLRRVPGYTLLKSATRGMVGLETQSDLCVALANIEEAWMLAFVVERHPDGLFTVFVPSAPTPAVGSVYFLTDARLKILNVSVSAAVSCIMRMGVGSRELFASAGHPLRVTDVGTRKDQL